MRLFRHFDETPDALKGGAIALGNFDGVHRGHQVVIEAARAAGRRRSVPWGVMSFEPHPRQVLSTTPKPFRLTSMRIKARLIEEMGADFALMQHFARPFAGIAAADFVDRVLVGALNVSEVVTGHDFVFGKGRLGDAELLVRMGEARGFGVTLIDPVLDEQGIAFSSSVVREALSAGRLAEAVRQLGRPWEIDGHVQPGAARGRALGYPTANISLGDLVRPAAGVYAVQAEIDGAGAWLPGVAYCGSRPTFEGGEVFLEVHLFDFTGDLYGRQLRVAMIEFLRPDQRFADIAALVRQMDQDSLAARKLLAAHVANEVNQ